MRPSGASSGCAAAGRHPTRQVASVAALVDAWDAIDPAMSRNLLAHVRRLAEEFGGSLPAALPPLPPTAATLTQTVAGGWYLRRHQRALVTEGDAVFGCATVTAPTLRRWQPIYATTRTTSCWLRTCRLCGFAPNG